jgi:hypothetical protein
LVFMTTLKPSSSTSRVGDRTSNMHEMTDFDEEGGARSKDIWSKNPDVAGRIE